MVAEKVSFRTTDGVDIAADFYPAGSGRGVLLVHQFNRDKKSYAGLANALNTNGFAALALDLRGHGESRGAGALSDPQSLRPQDFADMEKDLLAAARFLASKGVTRFYIVGASIGANLAISYPVHHAGFSASVALSPGIDFKGLQPLADAKRTRVPLLVVSSRDDAYSFSSSARLLDAVSAEKDWIRFDSAGHGTDMLKNEAGLPSRILDWIQRR
jgi:alpha-beta hydrolase superfamily lysophospholipase